MFQAQSRRKGEVTEEVWQASHRGMCSPGCMAQLNRLHRKQNSAAMGASTLGDDSGLLWLPSFGAGSSLCKVTPSCTKKTRLHSCVLKNYLNEAADVHNEAFDIRTYRNSSREEARPSGDGRPGQVRTHAASLPHRLSPAIQQKSHHRSISSNVCKS